MDFLVFQLQAPMSSWGEAAVGEYRGTATHPSQSALIGLLGAALGLRREDESAHAALRDEYGYVIGVLSAGQLLRDYHTAQVPPAAKLKGRPHVTRRQELALPRKDLGAVLSTRDYRLDAASLVAIGVREDAVPARFSLDQIAQALRTPVFTLYLGRKACPPASPLWPQRVEADSALAAMQVYRTLHEQARVGGEKMSSTGRTLRLLEPLPDVRRLYFDGRVEAGCAPLLTSPRKDRLIRRNGWQFGDRIEHMAVLIEDGE